MMALEKLRRLKKAEISSGRIWRGLLRRAESLPLLARWRWDPDVRENLMRLESYRDIHRGERCVILGNGPSLKRTDLSLLEGTPSFGLNRIALLFESCDFRPTYHCCFNDSVIAQFHEEIRQISCPSFVNFSGKKLLPSGEETIHVLERFSPSFKTCPGSGLWGGGTVTYVALQLAFFMGFQRVVLVGVDHRFNSRGEPNKRVVSMANDVDHFDPRYFNKGKTWDLPDLDGSEWAYTMAREHYYSAGKTIVDATVGGALSVFPKVDLRSEMSTSS